MNITNFTLSKETFVDSQMLCLYTRSPHLIFAKYLAAIFIFILLSGLYQMLSQFEFEPKPILIMIFMSMFTIYVFTFKYRLRKLYEKTIDIHGTIVLEYDEEGFETKCSHGLGKFKYSEIINKYENDKVLIFETTPMILRLFPKTDQSMVSATQYMSQRFNSVKNKA